MSDIDMKLSVWAKKRGISYKTAWRWFKAGTFPAGVTMEQMPTGTIVVNEPVGPPAIETDLKVALYARVSSADQKGDLDAQLGRLVSYAGKQGWTVIKAIGEVGSDEENLPELTRLLADPDVTAIVVEHRDRLMRSGLQYVESALVASGRKLIIAKEGAARERDRHD